MSRLPRALAAAAQTSYVRVPHDRNAILTVRGPAPAAG